MNYILTTKTESEFYHSADSENELYHYGVLGMKWGMRRAARKGQTYTYKSHGQKKWEKKIAKGNTSDKAKKKLAMYKERDKARQDYAANTSLGKAIVKKAALGSMVDIGTYNRFRDAGDSRASAYLKTKGLRKLDKNGLLGVAASRGTEKKRAKKRLKKQ